MAFIGNTSTTQSFTPAIDYFSGNGSTTAFTLTRPVASVAQVQVVVNNVAQNPSSAYSVSGSTITFTSAPSSGTSNIYVYYTSPITQVIQPSQGTVGKTQLDVYGGSGTGAMTIPAGTTAQRPSAPLAGDTRWNSTLSVMEVYVATGTWQAIASAAYTVDYLAVAGGGGGGGNGISGGGGAGGLLTANSLSVSAGTSYSITIGAGGAGGTTGVGSSGSNTSISGFSVTCIGGGGGGTNATPVNGVAGGSGGGGAGGIPAGTGGAGTSGQGFAGGGAVSSSAYGCGGGGGASAVGVTGTTTLGGNGGAGISNSFSGSAVTYAGGGGGSGGATAGSGGAGGGGNAVSSGAGVAGTANTGGGGGGAGSTTGGAGGSGIVIIRYVGTTARATGGTITTTGGYVIHTFTTSGTFTA